MSICVVGIKLFHNGPFERAARFEAGVEISPLLESMQTHLKSFTEIRERFISEVITLVKVILVLPANAASEHCFSVLRLIKCFQSTGQSRLNRLLLLSKK